MEYDRGYSFSFGSEPKEMGFHLVQNREENCHQDHIPFNLTGNGNLYTWVYTEGTFSEVLLNQPENRLYSPFSDWFGSKMTSVWIKINRKIVNKICFQVDLIRLLLNVSACNNSNIREPCLLISDWYNATKYYKIYLHYLFYCQHNTYQYSAFN